MTSMSNIVKNICNQDHVIDVTVTTMRFLEDEKIFSKQRLIEVFLFGTKKKTRRDLWRKTELCSPASNLVDPDFGKPIFIDEQQALNYGRFLPNDCCMLKAYVFDLAIESKENQLYLRHDYLQDYMIHGYYLSIIDSCIYIKNPEFNIKVLAKP